MYKFSLCLIILIGLMMYGSSNLEIVEARPIVELSPHDFNFSEPNYKIREYDFNFSNRLENLLPIPSNAHLIATELIELNETEIKDYPLTDLPPEEIKAVFSILDAGNLSKVLLNINDIAIKNIYDKLTPMIFNKIIEKISESGKSKIQNRVQ